MTDCARPPGAPTDSAHIVLGTAMAEFDVLSCNSDDREMVMRSQESTRFAIQETLEKTALSSTGQDIPQARPHNLLQYGLATLNGTLAVCLSTEARAQIVYRTINDEVSTIFFCHMNTYDGSKEPKFPWQRSADVDEGRAQRLILSHLDKELLSRKDNSLASLRLLYNIMILSVTFLGADCRQRLSQASHLIDILEAKLSLQAALEPERKFLTRAFTQPADSPEAVENSLRAFVSPRLQQLANHEKLSILVDRCPIAECEQPINLGPNDDCMCQAGHPLAARCGITFLPLFDPATIKYCTDCVRTFTNERVHPMCVGTEHAQTFPRYFLGMFPLCPYCNGKYFTKHRAP